MKPLQSTEYWGSRLAVLCSILFLHGCPWCMSHFLYVDTWDRVTQNGCGVPRSWGQLRCPEACVCSSLENTAPQFWINTHCPHFSQSVLSPSARPWAGLHLAFIVYIYWGVRDSLRLLPSVLICKPEFKRKLKWVKPGKVWKRGKNLLYSCGGLNPQRQNQRQRAQSPNSNVKLNSPVEDMTMLCIITCNIKSH